MVLFAYTTPNAKKDKFIKSRGVYVAFYSSMRVETACRFVSGAPNVSTGDHTGSPLRSF